MSPELQRRYTNAAIFTSIHTGVNGIQVFKVPQKDKASLPVPSNLGQGRQRNYSPWSWWFFLNPPAS